MLPGVMRAGTAPARRVTWYLTLLSLNGSFAGGRALKRRIRLSLKRDEALRANRVFIGNQKLVYLLIADKRLYYSKGKSRVAYIGTTANGGFRIAGSLAYRAWDILTLPGVRSLHVRVVTCKPRQRVKTWCKLERALLLEFKRRFGEVPWCNTHGRRMRESDEFQYFHRKGVANIIDELA
jgi:hypothetical protein